MSTVLSCEPKILTSTRSRASITRNPWFVAITLMIVAMLFDPTRVFTEVEYKQFPLLMVMGLSGLALLAGGFRIAKPCLPAMSYGALMLMAIPGLLQNKLSGAESSYFTAISLLAIPFSVYLLPRTWIRCDGREMVWLGVLGAAFGLGAIFLIFAERYGFGTLRIHERAFLAPLVIGVGLITRHRWLTVAGFACMGVILVLDPRTTMLLVVMMTVAMWLFIFRVDKKTRWLSAIFVIAVGLVAAMAGPEALREIDAKFKGAYKMEGNSDFRSNLLETGIIEFKKSPLIGDLFSGPTSFDSRWHTEVAKGKYEVIMAPLHNDYLEVLTKGGIIGGLFLIGGLGGTAVLGFYNHERFKRFGMAQAAAWQGMLCIAVAALLFTMMVNPVLNNPECAMPAYFLVAQIWAGERYLRGLRVVTPNVPAPRPQERPL